MPPSAVPRTVNLYVGPWRERRNSLNRRKLESLRPDLLAWAGLSSPERRARFPFGIPVSKMNKFYIWIRNICAIPSGLLVSGIAKGLYTLSFRPSEASLFHSITTDFINVSAAVAATAFTAFSYKRSLALVVAIGHCGLWLAVAIIAPTYPQTSVEWLHVGSTFTGATLTTGLVFILQPKRGANRVGP